jgi:hypothetical protein
MHPGTAFPIAAPSRHAKCSRTSNPNLRYSTSERATVITGLDQTYSGDFAFLRALHGGLHQRQVHATILQRGVDSDRPDAADWITFVQKIAVRLDGTALSNMDSGKILDGLAHQPRLKVLSGRLARQTSNP